ncbi:hypothetical protein SLEP1_g20676 [Rubroshorea leprosula]|uniref:Uncharacterized protein n=1 Tax=Rubroshorea leprosula TaxID=152421 RepID=A0AAV5JFE3_9ROSI|nr:hypothetical protein SLEP1_g20676 [Rubroshorea leprosula]
MAITPTADGAEVTLLQDTVDGSVDFKGRPVSRSCSGGWRSAAFIIAVEVSERFAYYGISSNLITYLTGQLGQSTATAAENVNAWSGTATLLPLLGAFVADAYLGRYRTIIAASLIYILVSPFLYCCGEARKQCSIQDVEDAKALLRLIPIWTTCLGYAIMFAQASTFFTKQGATMDRTVFPGFEIPAASLQFFIGISIIIFIPIYDRFFVPAARALTRQPSGITMLQRIGTGLFLSAICMVVAALVEMKRLKTALEYGLVDNPNATVPMSVWWMVPQYLIFGLADVFTIVGMQEFFYDQVPNELKSMGLSFYLSVIGVGSFLSSLLVSVIDKLSGDTWFSSNLNQAHLDYFYWLLAGLNMVGLAAFAYFSRSYVYNMGMGSSSSN